MGSSHNYYCGRVDSDITGWIGYFIEEMAVALKKCSFSND
jgi:hypothetical protein